MTPLERYVTAWLSGDPDRIAETVAAACIVTECYGPVYRGRETVRRWAQTWFGAGGVVHRWNIWDRFGTADREAAQWTFECTWQGRRSSFDGATVIRVQDGLVVELREYQTSAPLYEWNGTWR